MLMIQGRQSGRTSVLAQVWSFDRLGNMRLGWQNDTGHRIYSPQLVTRFVNY
jgi:hypothetical protein